jgi:hypothetical protein
MLSDNAFVYILHLVILRSVTFYIQSISMLNLYLYTVLSLVIPCPFILGVHGL